MLPPTAGKQKYARVQKKGVQSLDRRAAGRGESTETGPAGGCGARLFLGAQDRGWRRSLVAGSVVLRGQARRAQRSRGCRRRVRF